MKKKSFRRNVLSTTSTRDGQQVVIASNGRKKSNPLKARRALFVLGFLVCATIVFGAISNRRTLPLSSGAMPQGTPPQLPANAPSREYVYAGSALISTVEPFRQPSSDLGVWQPSTGIWSVYNSTSQQTATQQWGASTDIPAPGDFDGDGKLDFCVFRPSNGVWYIIASATNTPQYVTFGLSGDIPVVGDYDGDAKSDIALWRPSNSTWYIMKSLNNSFFSQAFGLSSDVPVASDYDGDGKSDVAIWRSSSNTFWVSKSSDNQVFSYPIGASGDEPVVGDYDGDGKADFAVRRPSDNYWRMTLSGEGYSTLHYEQWGLSTDLAVPARYNDSLDSDSKTDIAVWRPSTGVWYIRRSSDGSMRAQTFGVSGDKPLPGNWRR